MTHTRFLFAVATLALASLPMPAPALTKVPVKPLGERVEKATTVFVGTLTKIREEGDWVRAELVVNEGLKNAEVKAKIPVIWRRKLGNLVIYDAAEGTKRIAILGDKHEGRYWLRDDKFEPLDKLKEVRKLLAAEAAGKDQGKDGVVSTDPNP